MEFHTRFGPFTLVPLPGRRSSLVWVCEPQEATRLAALDDASLADEIERRSHSVLGNIAIESGRGLFPLSGMTARRFAGGRVALVGEAAHVIPPIGAQGFNLGLRDAAAIAKIAAEAVADGCDPGAADVLESYCRQRRKDAESRTLAVDLLNRSLLTNFVPFQAVRGLGLTLLGSVGPLRRALMREGVALGD
jgi:2-octaprenyl-6-methoxyphenol hydroxylase